MSSDNAGDATHDPVVLQVSEETHELTYPRNYLPPFGPREYGFRLERIRAELDRLNIDVAVISDPKSVWWLAAGKAKFEYADNPIWLLVSRDINHPVTAVLRHLERGTFERSSSAIVEDIVEYKDGGLVIPYDPVPVVADRLKSWFPGAFTYGIAARYFNVMDSNRLQEILSDGECINFPAEQVRSLKSPVELEVMRVAANANSQALHKALLELQIGMTEWDFARRVEALHSDILGPDYGGTSGSAQTAQFGSHAHDMHPKRLASEMQTMVATPGTAGNVEPGAFVKAYVGCMMRPVFFGSQVPQIVVDAIRASAEGLNNAIELMAPGVRCSDVDAVIRGAMLKTGLEVRSRTGYGCGIEWDEGNSVSLAPGNHAELQEGNTLHVIAHTYGPYGFLGLSEQVVITADGCEVLADGEGGCPRQLFLVG